MRLFNAQLLRDALDVLVGHPAARQNDQLPLSMLYQICQVGKILLDGRSRPSSMGEDMVHAHVRECIDRLELRFGIKLVKSHVEGNTKLSPAHLAHTARNRDQALGTLDIKLETIAGALEASQHHAVHPVGGCVANIGLHSLELTFVVSKIAAARTDDDAHARPFACVDKGDRLLYHAGGGSCTAAGKVVAQLYAASARIERGLDIGKIFSAELS